MGDLLGSFPGNFTSKDKACWKDSCCYCEASCQVGMLQMVSETTSPITVCFGDEPSGSWWACDTRGRRGRGVIAGAVRHGQGAAPGRLLGGGTHDLTDTAPEQEVIQDCIGMGLYS